MIGWWEGFKTVLSISTFCDLEQEHRNDDDPEPPEDGIVAYCETDYVFGVPEPALALNIDLHKD